MIEVRGLSVSYGEQVALRGVDLSIGAGEVLALLGPSGCGKSTFLRCLNRLHEEVPGVTVRGRIELAGQSIFTLPVVTLRRRVGMLFQKPNPFPLSIFDNVAYGLRLLGRTGPDLHDRVRTALEAVGLWSEVKRRLGQSALGLSGGQQQRLCLARALAVEPEVLLLDEPTSALDPRATAQLEELFASLRGRYTQVLVTHQLSQAQGLADRIAFFSSGELVEVAPTAAFFAAPADPRTRAFLGQPPLV